MISDVTIQAVRDLAIEDVIRPYVRLKRQGSRLVGLCPFHAEKNPSFSISPNNNLFYCFSCKCGGDAIEFIKNKENLSFIEAVRFLANRYNIPIENVDEDKSPEEIELRNRREAIFITLDIAQKFFVERLNDAKNEESQRAFGYCTSRWPEDVLLSEGLGYAPADTSLFLEYCRNKNIEEALLMESGLLGKNDKGDVYVRFKERIMMPIRDRYGRIISYTGRYIGSWSKANKYLNTPNTLIYNKSTSLFGLHKAFRSKDSGMINIVEGAPDVLRLHSIGFDNTVAALGTALTESQCDLLRNRTNALCFIPDADPSEDGSFGAGISAVLTNGSLAVRKGFNVTVREIPLRRRKMYAEEIEEAFPDGAIESENQLYVDEKADADSAIKDQSDYYSLNEELFIPWLAKKRFSLSMSMAREHEIVEEISDLLLNIRDSLILSRCLDEIAEIHGKKKFWKEALNQARSRNRKDHRKLDSLDEAQREIEQLRRCGMFVRDNCYYTIGDDDQNPALIANFIMEPLYHILDDSNGSRIFRLRNEDGNERLIELKESDLCSLPCFMQRTGSVGNFVWLAKSDRLNGLKRFLYARTDTAERVRKLGWNAVDEFYAFGNGIFTSGSFISVDDLGIVRTGNGKAFYLPANSKMYISNREAFQFERLMIHSKRSGVSLPEYITLLTDVFGDKARIAFCYLLSTIFRDVIFGVTRHFPILNLFGEKGTGKTTLATCLQSFFLHGVDPPNLGVTSVPAMNDRVSQAVNILIVLDEYKNDLDFKKIAYLKGLWGGGGQTKKNVNSDGMATQTIVSTGIALCGQDKPTQDMALFTRVLFLSFSKTSFNQTERTRYEDLVSMCDMGLTHLTLEVLKHRSLFEKNFRNFYKIAKNELAAKTGSEEFHERIFGNWVIPLATYRTLESVIEFPFSYPDLLSTALTGLREQNDLARESSEVGDFWNALQGFQTSGKIIEGVHFHIRYLRNFKPLNESEMIEFQSPKPILYLNMAAIASVFSGRNSNPTANRSNWSTIVSYVKSHHSYLGLKQDRFKLLNASGMPDMIVDIIDGKQVRKQKVNRPKAFCFDYSELRDTFGLDLETSLISEEDAPDDEVFH